MKSGYFSTFSDSHSGDLFGGSNSGLFGSSNTGSQQSSGLFGQPPAFPEAGNQSVFGQTGTQSGFGQTGSQSLFGQSSTQSTFGQTGAQQSGFGQSSSLFGQGAFTQDTQSGSTFGQSVFGQAPSSSFGQDQTQKTGLFGKPADNSPFGAASFNNPQTSGASGNLFQTSTPFGQSSEPAKGLFGKSVTVVPPVSGFGAAPAAENKPAEQAQASGETSSVYTPLDQLTPEELEHFKGPMFSLGFIPTKPPPRELCF